ncbi:MAG: hypothetical protein LBV28_03635 [Puniceicoccales bacterium]|jgi:hypothetical protein|nr:hypothetical protein [Puniceicoccales bacterium]
MSQQSFPMKKISISLFILLAVFAWQGNVCADGTDAAPVTKTADKTADTAAPAPQK